MLETDRIKLRNWKISDAENLYKYASDELVGPLTGWSPHKNVEESKNIIQNFFNKNTFAIVLKETNEIVGSIGLCQPRIEKYVALDEMEVGYWIARPYWGQRIAPEAMELIKEYSFNTLKLKKLWCVANEHNLNSRRVQQKCGFEVQFKNNGKVYTAIDNKRWLASSLYYIIASTIYLITNNIANIYITIETCLCLPVNTFIIT